MIQITTPRALFDWINRPKTLRDVESEQEASDGAPQMIMPGVIGRTKFRVTWELDPRTAAALLAKCNEALADDRISDSMRNAIEATKRQVEAAIALLEGQGDA